MHIRKKHILLLFLIFLPLAIAIMFSLVFDYAYHPDLPAPLHPLVIGIGYLMSFPELMITQAITSVVAIILFWKDKIVFIPAAILVYTILYSVMYQVMSIGSV